MTFARWVFRIAGIYGIAVLLPLCFMEAKLNRDDPPAITHAEYFYGFLGVGLAWQVAFLIISRDPARYRPMMLPSVIEKFSFAAVAIVLFMQHRLSNQIFVSGIIDLLLGLLFLGAYFKISPERICNRER